MEKYTVPYADTDKMGVVYYANYYLYFERARNSLLAAAGFPYSLLEEGGTQLPIVESFAKYSKPAFFEDKLSLKAKVSWIKKVKIKFTCTVYRNDIVLCEGYTIHGSTCRDTGRVKLLPESFCDKIRSYCEEQE